MENTIFQAAEELIQYTSQNLFLTGKAGTGKTTFLRHIVKKNYKKTVVTAPTGVAAINAQGVTLHSLFQLPFGSFLPIDSPPPDMSFTTRFTLFRNMRLNSKKRKLINDIELLIIDEISMVRADTLDAVDTILRRIRRNPLPFGGVQVLFIGDLFQLPPVIKNHEWNRLKEYYESPYFFHSQVLKQQPPVRLELNKVYRQTDIEFIELLNGIRYQEFDGIDFDKLHARFQPNFQPKDEHYITLTTHNRQADEINDKELNALDGMICRYDAEIKGNFSESMYPCETELFLKKGAQVMFIKNDSQQEEKRYYNGKIGTVDFLDENDIIVKFPEGDTLKVPKETWENIRYEKESETGKIKEEVIGKFIQYPLRLAWAVTIHKSQGLTFDKVIIDAGESFAFGQVYVALSRCTTLDGIILRSKIRPQSIHPNPLVMQYHENMWKADKVQQLIEQEKVPHAIQQFIQKLNPQKMLFNVEDLQESALKKEKVKDAQAHTMLNPILQELNLMNNQFLKYRQLLVHTTENEMVTEGSEALKNIQERAVKALAYFYNETSKQVMRPLIRIDKVLSNQTGVSRFRKELAEVKKEINLYFKDLRELKIIDFEVFNSDLIKVNLPEIEVDGKEEKPKKEKTHEITFRMFKEGMKAAAIAKERNLVITTIESHFSKLIQMGKLNITEVMDKKQAEELQKEIQSKLPIESLSELKSQLKDDISFGEIRMVLASLEKV